MHSAPLRLLNDGDSAVFRFVARSGDVLTPGFLRGAGHPARLLRFLLAPARPA